MVCNTCRKIAKDKNNPNMLRARPGDVCSPLVPVYILKPHLCLFSTLREVQRLFDLRHIDHTLLDEWFALNGGDYQMGGSRECMKLWNDVTRRKHAPSPPTHLDHLMDSKPSCVEVVSCKKHGGSYLKWDWGKVRHDRDYDWLDEFWKWSSPADRAKTTLSAGQLIKHVAKHDWARKAVSAKWQYLSAGLPNVTVVALVINILGNPHADRNFELLCKYHYCCLDVKSYQAIMKAVSIAIRRTSRFPDGKEASLDEITSMAGWELATGRSENKTDWEDELDKRTKRVLNLGSPLIEEKDCETNKDYVDDLKVELRTIMQELVQVPKRSPSWADFVQDRQSWVSSGSTGGLKIDLDDGSRIRANKHAIFETITKEDMIQWLDEEPEIKATASEKFEMGKSRAIYGTGIKDYSIHAYVLADIEPNLSRVEGIEYGLRGKAMLATMIRRMAEVMDRDPECTNIDYADFNYQHTLLAQAATYFALAAVLKNAGHHPDKVKAANWCARSLLNQWVKFPELRTGYVKVSQGMFSGFRGTNFLNTILNVAYFRLADKQVRKYFGVFSRDLYHIHMGDDVWISNMCRLWAVALFNCMIAAGLVFQPSKQMFERSKGEFLRVVYTKEGCRGYLARKIATMVMKPIQSTDVVTPAERAVALNDQIATLARRGYSLEACALVWEAVVPYAARTKLAKGTLCIPKSILLKHHLDNGLDIGSPRTAAARGKMIPQLPSMELKSAILERSVPMHMTNDWIQLVSRRFKDSLDADALRTSIHRINITDSLRQEDRTLGLRHYEHECREYLKSVEIGPVSRTAANYVSLTEGEGAGPTFEWKVKELCDNLLGKGSTDTRSTLACIMSCVGASTFKSINTAMVATKKSKIQALKLCVNQAPDSAARVRALDAISSIESRCGEAILCSIIGGVGAGANKYYSEFHPEVLSWIQSEAFETTLLRAQKMGVKDEGQFREMVDEDFDRHVRTARRDGRLLVISRY
ncbi:RNA-dependent RNA polymerase [Culex vishnui subgroup totivirus]|uniref:RNA-directed RNA polymerase n=1 Tax=Culex vishnui subgroup totivirus TaxID=2686045 RepID=A0A6F8PZE0_9VIRU|nr:RNA-dependent RNA polymerase [Culex vishnui subgroup totivirus]BDV27038.1 RNA-dependent RNA polymerase [Culex vishnui subgroup totivirus]